MLGKHRLTRIEDYKRWVGAETVERIMGKAKGLQHLHVSNVNSTFYGGGVAELLRSFTLLMNSVEQYLDLFSSFETIYRLKMK